MMRKLLAILAAGCLLLSGCGKDGPEQRETTPAEVNNTVGICLPDFSWSQHAERLTALLEDAGCQVYVEYAGGDVQQQHAQVQTLVNMPVSCLVVAAIDSMMLSDVLCDARQENVPVIALDRMLMYTDAVTGCVGMDSYAAGQQLGRYIVEEKQLTEAKEPVTVEFLMGSPENNNALLLYQGVMEQLQPYLVSGVLQCRSGRTSFEDTWIQPETADAASDRCFDYLTEFYTDAAPDVVCAATDILAIGCIDALDSFGLEIGEDWPLVTGVGATEEGLQNLADGCQRVTVHTDDQALAQQCAQWVQAAAQGEPIAGQTVFNGVADVPACLFAPTLVEQDDYKDLLPEE